LEVEDDENSIWSLNLWKLQFSPQTLKNYRLVPGAYSEILNRIKDELWAEFLYSYEILTLQFGPPIWQKLQFDPTNLENFQNGPWSIIRGSGHKWGLIMDIIPLYSWIYDMFSLVLQLDENYNLTVKNMIKIQISP
jgi:hypothetical protein